MTSRALKARGTGATSTGGTVDVEAEWIALDGAAQPVQADESGMSFQPAPLAESEHPGRVPQQVRELLRQVIDVAALEADALFPQRLQVLWYVTHENGVAIAHRLQQSEREALQL